MRTIRDCNVAVIGGAGFLGSHLVNHLIKDRGCRVIVVDNLCAGRREFVHEDAEFVYHDITGSEDRLFKVFKQMLGRTMRRAMLSTRRPLYVFNYAAWPYIPDSFARPLHVADVNFMGAIKVINAAQEAGADGILQISSAEIYGYGAAKQDGDRIDEGKIDEKALVCPHSTYGVAKAAVDNFVQCAWKERETPCIALRQFNCVGERETHPYVVPEIISQLAAQIGEDTGTVRLGNNSFRDFLYAGDQVRIAVELLERGQFGEVFNLGSETGIKMYNLAKLIGKVMGFADVQVIEDETRKRPWEIWHLQADCSKLMNILRDSEKLRNPTPLEEALRRTVADFVANGRKWCWQ